MKHFLFLQRPTNTLFSQIAERLLTCGHKCFSLNLNLGDALFSATDNAVDYQGTFDAWPDFIRRFVVQHAITDIVLLGEQRAYHRTAIEIAKENNINVFVTDFGYLRPDWVIIERDGMNGESHFPRDLLAIMKLAEGLPPIDKTLHFKDSFFKQAIWDMAYHLSQVYWPFRFPYYQRHTLVHPFLVYPGIGARLLMRPIMSARAVRILASLKATAFFIFAMQTEDDFSLRAYSDYPDLDSPMRETVASFAKFAPPEAQLVFKIHPLDPGLKRWRRRIRQMAQNAGIAARVYFIDGGHLDSALQACAGLVTVNSTVGLRAIELGCPVIALGQAVYRVNGLTFEASLDRFWADCVKPDAVLADAFLRALAASLHVRGAMYSKAGIKAAAEGMAYRLHYGLVNLPIAEVNQGKRLVVGN